MIAFIAAAPPSARRAPRPDDERDTRDEHDAAGNGTDRDRLLLGGSHLERTDADGFAILRVRDATPDQPDRASDDEQQTDQRSDFHVWAPERGSCTNAMLRKDIMASPGS